MNKELEAFERIIAQRSFVFLGGRMSGKTEMAKKEMEQRQKDIKCVEKALKENKKLKKCLKNELKNVSYYNNLALKNKEALENYRNRMNEWESGHSVDFSKVRFDIQNLLPEPTDIMKKLKALEIIKEKRVNVLELSVCADYETYISFFKLWSFKGEYDYYKLTRKEFDFLKEILK